VARLGMEDVGPCHCGGWVNEEHAVMNCLEIDLALHVLIRGPGCATLPSFLTLVKGRDD
jgi:hypothetical protein